jgi:uncharacterized protein YjbJ (UPF0337 family)
MGLGDKITGRVKQAAGDLSGDDELRRRGLEDERKGEAKEDLARAEERAAAEQQRADLKRAEVDSLERRTDGDRLLEDKDKDELYEEAQALDVPGRSDMTKDELADEVARRRA